MVVVSLQAVVLLGIGGLLIALRADPALGGDQQLLVLAGAVLVVVGLVQLTLVALLGRGSEVARSTFGILAGLQTAAGVYSTIALRDFEPAALVPLAMSVGVLWLLYGSDTTHDFFVA